MLYFRGLSNGHRAIAHISGTEDTSTGRERLDGYRKALEAAGVPFQSELVIRTTVDRIGGYRATQEILARDPLPTAIFAVNNITAIGAMEALREQPMVPRDMGLVCFGDVEHVAVLSPFLTVVDQPSETFGRLGAQLLLERMTGKANVRARRIVLQTNLIVRTSRCVESGAPAR
jgi:LacI family transcriptional regulator